MHGSMRDQDVFCVNFCYIKEKHFLSIVKHMTILMEILSIFGNWQKVWHQNYHSWHYNYSAFALIPLQSNVCGQPWVSYIQNAKIIYQYVNLNLIYYFFLFFIFF